MLFLLASACGKQVELAPLGKDAVILAFGDSLTHGTGARPDESYPALLEQLAGRKVINGGVPGELSADGLKRLPGLLDRHAPSLLILCHGGNDILRRRNPDQAAANMEKMIRLAQSRGVEVVMLGVPGPGIFLNAADFYKHVARATDVSYIDDLVSGILSTAALKSDPIHPNGDGYREMARRIHEHLQQAGAL